MKGAFLVFFFLPTFKILFKSFKQIESSIYLKEIRERFKFNRMFKTIKEDHLYKMIL